MPTTSKRSPKAAAPTDAAKAGAGVPDDESPELDAAFFENAEVGKYYFEMMRGSNVVRIAPDLIEQFPNEQSVNDALRLLAGLRRVLTAPPVEDAGEQRKRTA